MWWLVVTDDIIYNTIHSIIALVTGLANDHIIPADDNYDAPNSSYASIKIGSNRSQRGQANITKSNTGLVASPIGNVRDVNHDIKSQIVVDVDINFYRSGAIENASNLFQANKLPTVSDILFQANIGWSGTSAVNDLSVLQSKEQEERSQITITLLYEQVKSVTTNAIYEVTVVVENENGVTIQSETSNSPTGV